MMEAADVLKCREFLLALVLLSIIPQCVTEGFVNECELSQIHPSNPSVYVNITLEFNLRQPGKDRWLTSEVVEAPTSIVNSPHEPVTGLLIVPTYDTQGCEQSSYGVIPKEDWVALVERGACIFENKGSAALSLGAKGIVVYQNTDTAESIIMSAIPENLTAVVISRDIGVKYADLVNNETAVIVTLSKTSAPTSRALRTNDSSNYILLVFACVMCPTAVILNLGSLIAIIYYPEKRKPHIYVILNLVVTDLLVATIGTAAIALLYPKLAGTEEVNEYREVYVTCIADILNEVWDLAMFSNLFTLLILTAEHFIVFRWPMKHKIVVTKPRVLIMICLSWLLSATPFLSVFISDLFDTSVPACYRDKGFCWTAYYHMRIKQGAEYSLVKAMLWILSVGAVFLSMVLVYGYILLIVHRVSRRNPGFRRKGTAVVTALCLVISFFFAYIFFFIQHCYAAASMSYNSELLKSVQRHFYDLCPACPLMIDFLLTGMIGAIMDPIIYCVRMKEMRLPLTKLCKHTLFSRRLSFTSGSGYARAAQNSVTVDVTDETL